MTELVDVSDLGSEFWQFKSASGYISTLRASTVRNCITANVFAFARLVEW